MKKVVFLLITLLALSYNTFSQKPGDRVEIKGEGKVYLYMDGELRWITT